MRTPPNEPSSSSPLWAPEDLGAFVGQVRNDRFFALWMLATTTDVQLTMLTRLERRDVDLDQHRISSPPAAVLSCGHTRRRPRSYALDPIAYGAVKEHVDTWGWERYILGQDTRKLFVWSNGQQVDIRALRTMFRQHCEAAGVPVVPLKEVRQAYAIAALKSGIPVRVISDRLSDNARTRAARTTERGTQVPAHTRRSFSRGRKSYRIEDRRR